MSGWWLVSYVVNWVLLIALGIFCIAILRQLGLLYVRLGGSLGALQTADGPELGAPLPVTSVHDSFGVVRSLLPEAGHHKLLVFMSPTCEICDPMVPHMPGFSRSLKSHAEMLVMMTSEDTTGKFSSWRPGAPPMVIDQSLAEMLVLPAMPYAVVVDDQGRIVSKGVFNDMVQLESLLNEAESRTPAHDHGTGEPVLERADV